MEANIHNNAKTITKTDLAKDLIKTNNIQKAFLICDVENIVQKYKQWKLTFPRIKPYYAIHCNSNAAVIETLKNLDSGFSCKSPNEIKNLINRDIPHTDIILSSILTQTNHIKSANSQNIFEYVKLGSIYDLQMLENKNNKVLLHMTVSGLTNYGCCSTKEASTILKQAKLLGINIVGVSIDLGRVCTDLRMYQSVIKESRYIFNMAGDLNFDFCVLNIGDVFLFENSAYELNEIIEELFPNEDTTIIAEPSTYLVRSAFTLIAKIINVKEEDLKLDFNNVNRRFLYYVDDSVFGTLNRAIFSDAFKPISFVDNDDTVYDSKVFGHTCDSSDLIVNHCQLPMLKAGDWLMFEDVGDYSMSLQTSFHGFSSPKVYYID